jgi:glucose-6-phosphate 1-dehydrogenase
MTPRHRSDAFVLFGATGDLAYKQIFPALQAMVRRGMLDMPVIGVAKGGWTLAKLRERVRASLIDHPEGLDPTAFERLVNLLRYVDGDYHDPGTFDALRAALGGASHPLYYLAIPPSLFPLVAKSLGALGSAGSRVIVEKPFGRDLRSAKQLNRCLRDVFPEHAVFRIDHFLGKEAVQNLVVFRFANTFLEPIWNRHHIDSVQITMAESFGTEGRGAFYEETGAIRDVVQNHLLQVVGFLAMEHPANTYNEAIRDELVKLFRQIRPCDPASLVRGQFRGYREEAGVSPHSQVETFAAVRLDIDSWRWHGVPFFIRTGKRLPVTATEVIVQFKQPPLSLLAEGRGNYLRLTLSPQVRIDLGARIKRPGEGLVGVLTELTLVHEPSNAEMMPYERLLADAIEGDATLFSRYDAIKAAWKVVEPVLGNVTPVHDYEPGSWGPSAAEQLMRDFGGWRT